MSKDEKVLVTCDNYKQVRDAFKMVLDIYEDTNLITTYNKKKRKICMYPNYIWYFKEKDAANMAIPYHKVYSYEDIKKLMNDLKSQNLQ